MKTLLIAVTCCLALVTPRVASADDIYTTTDAQIAAIDVVVTPVITDLWADTVLLNERAIEVVADTGVVTVDGFIGQVNLRDDQGILVGANCVVVAPNGTLQFTLSPTTLFMPSTNFTLEVLQADPVTDEVSVVSALNLAPLGLYGKSTDSVSQTVANAIATGNLQIIRDLLAIGAENGLSQAQITLLREAILRITAQQVNRVMATRVADALAQNNLNSIQILLSIGVRGGLAQGEIRSLQLAYARILASQAGQIARQKAIEEAQRAAMYALQSVRQGTQAFDKAMAALANAMFKYGYQPVCNAFTVAALRNYMALAAANIAVYQNRINSSIQTITSDQLTSWRAQIIMQQERIAQIEAWLRANGLTP